MIEGDLTEISSDVVRKALCETIEQQLKSNKYKLVVSSASKAGENNFIGIIYRVIFGTDGNENGKNPNLQLILKVAPQNVVRRDQFFARPAFMREIYTYETVLPILCQFEQSKGVDKERFIEYPKCYRTVDEEPNECLLFEDLSVRGFTVIDRRREEVTVDHVRLVMETLGKFHGISFAFKDQQPDKFNEIVSNLSEVFIRREDDHLRDFFNKQCEHVFNSVSREEDATVLAKAKKLYECDAFDVAADCLEMVGPATVISHGDAWQNNTMFRYDSSGKPIEICFLDWQTTRHTTPIIDIVYYMFCCTTKELRDAHYNELLEIYHDSLSAHIRRLGSDPDKLFPFSLMLEHFRKFAKFGLILSTVLLPMMTSDDGSRIDLDEMAEDVKNGKEVDKDTFISENSRKKFNKRMRGVVIDMARLGYI